MNTTGATVTYTEELITAARSAAHLDSDSALAALLKVAPQTLHQYKTGAIPVPDRRLVALAKIARLEPGRVYVDYRAATESDAQVRAVFQALQADMARQPPKSVKRTRKGLEIRYGALLAGFLAVGATTLPARALAAPTGVRESPDAGIYIMRTSRHRRRRVRKLRIAARS